MLKMKSYFWAVCVASAAMLSGCLDGGGSTPVASNNQAPAPAKVPSGKVVSILAGSELKDVEPDVTAALAKAGYKANFVFSGTLDAVDKLCEGEKFDVLWVSHNKYAQLAPCMKGQIKRSEKTMYSRVVIGVKPESMAKLGWKQGQVTWKDVSTASAAGKMKFAMTNPTGSNTGFVALMGLATELSGKGDALEPKDIPSDKLGQFFKGQALTSGSSGELAKSVARAPELIDAMINYESVIKGMEAQGVKMVAMYPKEGVVTADYPAMLLAGGNEAAYNELVGFMKSDAVQKGLVKSTGRDPLVGSSDGVLVAELPFPGNIETIDAVLKSFLNKVSKPSNSYFVLDVSGSMSNGGRMDAMKTMMTSLTPKEGASSQQSRFASIRSTEKVVVIPFDGEVYEAQRFDFSKDPAMAKASYKLAIENLAPRGGTAVFSATWSAYQAAQSDMRDGSRFASIVVITDGESNAGISQEQYTELVKRAGAPFVPVYMIQYGEANRKQLEAVTKVSGGNLFDGRNVSLDKVIRSIRQWQ